MPQSQIVATTDTAADKLTPESQPLNGASQIREATPSIPKNPNHVDRSLCVEGRKTTSRELARILRNGINFLQLIF